MILITGADVVRLDRIEWATDVLIDGQYIRALGDEATRQAEGQAVERVDGRGKILSPGFIDMHFHGAGEFLVDRGAEDLSALCGLLPKFGVTSFLPTVTPKLPEQHCELVASLTAGDRLYTGTRITGLFLEGPFLKLTGSLSREALTELTSERVEDLKQASSPYPAVFAAAPDVDGAIDLIPLMRENANSPSGTVPVFITHTAATVEETQAGIDAGISHATHFYDVFPCPDEADPGVRPCGAVEAILADPRVTVDFILDGEHVNPVAAQMALQTKGPKGVSLVTDANLGAGLPPGRYIGFDDMEIEFAYEGAPARMTEKERMPGCLAGSGLTMDRAVRNAIKLLGVDVVQAIRMASANPASVIGTFHETGSIDLGKLADLVLLDKELSVERTWVSGEAVFAR